VFLLLSITARQDQEVSKSIVFLFVFLSMLFSTLYENLLTSDLTLDPPEPSPGDIYNLIDKGYYVFTQRLETTALVSGYMIEHNCTEGHTGKTNMHFDEISTLQNLGLAYLVMLNTRKFVSNKNKISFEVFALEEYFGNDKNLQWKIKSATNKNSALKSKYSQRIDGYYPVAFRVMSLQRDLILKALQTLMESGIVDFEKRKSLEDFEYLRRMKTLLDPFEGRSFSRQYYFLVDMYENHENDTLEINGSDGFIQLKNVQPVLYFCSALYFTYALSFLVIHTVLSARDKRTQAKNFLFD